MAECASTNPYKQYTYTLVHTTYYWAVSGRLLRGAASTWRQILFNKHIRQQGFKMKISNAEITKRTCISFYEEFLITRSVQEKPRFGITRANKIHFRFECKLKLNYNIRVLSCLKVFVLDSSDALFWNCCQLRLLEINMSRAFHLHNSFVYLYVGTFYIFEKSTKM